MLINKVLLNKIYTRIKIRRIKNEVKKQKKEEKMQKCELIFINLQPTLLI